MADNSSAKRGFDLDGMTVAELTALRDAAEAKRLEKLEDAKAAVHRARQGGNRAARSFVRIRVPEGFAVTG